MKFNNIWPLILIISALFIFGCAPPDELSNQPNPDVVEENISPPTPASAGPAGSTEEVKKTIEITSAGFNPDTLTIEKGETVTFVNTDLQPHWPASAIHPTHTLYPGSSTAKCNTPEESSTFDACRGLEQGGTYSFIFNLVGSWKYHDHLNPNSRGTIIVE